MTPFLGESLDEVNIVLCWPPGEEGGIDLSGALWWQRLSWKQRQLSTLGRADYLERESLDVT